VSLEIILHPKAASRDNIARRLRDLGYRPTKHLWDWHKDSLNFHWFEHTDYLSYDGVEATIYKASSDKHQLGACEWALHTHTRSSASPADKDHQDETIRSARAKFGGNFYNDWHGRNRYTRREPDGRDAVSRGIYISYEIICQHIRDVRYATPPPTGDFAKLAELAVIDPTRVLYNALVPFALASLESFFSSCFKILLRYDTKAQEKLRQQSRKVDFEDVIAVKNGARTVEDIVADRYSFQNIASIDRAFSEWFGIDFWAIIRKRKKLGNKIALLEDRLNCIIDFRHGIIHRMEVDRRLAKSQVDDIFAATLAIIDAFVEHIEKRRGTPIRDASLRLAR
jgi:hypothetical protein